MHKGVAHRGVVGNFQPNYIQTSFVTLSTRACHAVLYNDNIKCNLYIKCEHAQQIFSTCNSIKSCSGRGAVNKEKTFLLVFYITLPLSLLAVVVAFFISERRPPLLPPCVVSSYAEMNQTQKCLKLLQIYSYRKVARERGRIFIAEVQSRRAQQETVSSDVKLFEMLLAVVVVYNTIQCVRLAAA